MSSRLENFGFLLGAACVLLAAAGLLVSFYLSASPREVITAEGVTSAQIDAQADRAWAGRGEAPFRHEVVVRSTSADGLELSATVAGGDANWWFWGSIGFAALGVVCGYWIAMAGERRHHRRQAGA